MVVLAGGQFLMSETQHPPAEIRADVLELLEGLMNLNHLKRCTASGALALPFFAKSYDAATGGASSGSPASDASTASSGLSQ
ncbi:hypothetical protein T484DRAFT_1797021 [Baffinella frigidus]|nr:hypothetical protein T484DRAFT_1797021 [Cryptophyta sp. CCMP2293]